MAKPLLIVRTPHTNKDTLKEIRQAISDMSNHEYHVFLVNKKEGDVTFETHNAENLTPLDVKDLARLVNEHNEEG